MLQRLLRGRSFLVGVGPDATTGDNRITWVRVLGTHESASARRARGRFATEQRLVNVPTALLSAAFTGENEEKRKQELAAIRERFLSDPAQLRAFLALEPRDIADSIRRFPEAESVVAKLAREQHDPTIRKKLEAVRVSLVRSD